MDIWSDYTLSDIAGKSQLITNQRGKNENEYYVPLFSLSEVILSHYNNELPKLENAPYNRYLKEIGAILNIKEHLTTHVARKTFAALRDEEGWSLEAIRRMLGHSSVKMTETHYLPKNKKRIVEEMKKFGMA